MPAVEAPRRRRAARLLTEAGAPVVVLVAMPIVIGLHSSFSAEGLGWGLLAALFFGVIPFGYVLRGVRQKRWADHHVGEREQRKPVFVFSLGFMLVGLLLLAVAGAPDDLVAFLATLLIEAAVALAVTLVWKISLHTWVSSIGATALVVVLGPWALLLWPFLSAVGWSRVELEDHSLAQVVAGALMGTLITALVFPLLR
jgi:membrane-associated phospholipid phosphatase